MFSFYQQYLVFFLIPLLCFPLVRCIKNIKSEGRYRLAYNTIYSVYTLAIFGVYLMNLWNLPLLLCAAGSCLNRIVMVTNRGFMPVDIDVLWLLYSEYEENLEIKLEEICKTSRIHTKMSSSTRLKLLGDIFPPDGHSIGDKFLVLGSSLINIHIAILIPFYILTFFFGS